MQGAGVVLYIPLHLCLPVIAQNGALRKEKSGQNYFYFNEYLITTPCLLLSYPGQPLTSSTSRHHWHI